MKRLVWGGIIALALGLTACNNGEPKANFIKVNDEDAAAITSAIVINYGFDYDLQNFDMMFTTKYTSDVLLNSNWLPTENGEFDEVYIEFYSTNTSAIEIGDYTIIGEDADETNMSAVITYTHYVVDLTSTDILNDSIYLYAVSGTLSVVNNNPYEVSGKFTLEDGQTITIEYDGTPTYLDESESEYAPALKIKK